MQSKHKAYCTGIAWYDSIVSCYSHPIVSKIITNLLDYLFKRLGISCKIVTAFNNLWKKVKQKGAVKKCFVA